MKEMLSTDKLIKHMKEKGITFDIISEKEATNFLRYNNYYFKLAAYRNLYPKNNDSNSSKKGQYENLDFGYLKELSSIDKHIRYLVMEMCLDIEHIIRVRLLDSVTTNSKEDGYEIVKSYFSNEDKSFGMLKSIRKHKSGEYCKDLIKKYYPYFPIWVLVELISFGELLHITQFYEDNYHVRIMPANKFMNTVRDLRNASAHSNCLLNNINKQINNSEQHINKHMKKQPDVEINDFVRKCQSISNNSRAKYMKRIFTYDFATLLYVYDFLMPTTTKAKRFHQLHEFMLGRVVEHKEYFVGNSKIIGAYNFLNKLIDYLDN